MDYVSGEYGYFRCPKCGKKSEGTGEKVNVLIEEMGYDIPEDVLKEIEKDYQAFMDKWKKYFNNYDGLQRMG